MKAREIQARPGHQGRQACHKVQWLQDHVRRPIPERLFVLVHGPAPAIDGQALGGNGRAATVCQRLFFSGWIGHQFQ